MKKFIILLTAIYLIIMAYFAAFNWNIFLLKLDINFGFKVVQMPLIGSLVLVGFIFYLMLWAILSFSNARTVKKLAKTNAELLGLKTTEKSSIDEKYDKLLEGLDEILHKINVPEEKKNC